MKNIKYYTKYLDLTGNLTEIIALTSTIKIWYLYIAFSSVCLGITETYVPQICKWSNRYRAKTKDFINVFIMADMILTVYLGSLRLNKMVYFSMTVCLVHLSLHRSLHVSLHKIILYPRSGVSLRGLTSLS